MLVLGTSFEPLTILCRSPKQWMTLYKVPPYNGCNSKWEQKHCYVLCWCLYSTHGFAVSRLRSHEYSLLRNYASTRITLVRNDDHVIGITHN